MVEAYEIGAESSGDLGVGRAREQRRSGGVDFRQQAPALGRPNGVDELLPGQGCEAWAVLIQQSRHETSASAMWRASSASPAARTSSARERHSSNECSPTATRTSSKASAPIESSVTPRPTATRAHAGSPAASPQTPTHALSRALTQ